MAKFIATIKAVLTRLVFGAHGFVAIWQVTQFKKNQMYWYMCAPMILLFFEGVFTLTIKENQEWKWFCPSVFLYLGSVVPAIWLLELDKVDRRLKMREETFNISSMADLNELHRIIGVQLQLPHIHLNTETWITLIEQFLMLTLIIGRWMLPKGDLTRDQLSQLLLVYIGTAADIIEFFDSFKDDKIASEPILVMLTLAIWSWSLMQFTVVLTATKSRKSRLSSNGAVSKTTKSGCCNIDVWGIALNIVLQDAPFLAFRLLIILHYEIISYMNVFFTCKNTLVILLQLYRLYVVHTETHKGGGPTAGKATTKKRSAEMVNVAVISRPSYNKRYEPVQKFNRANKKYRVGDRSTRKADRYFEETDKSSGNDFVPVHRTVETANGKSKRCAKKSRKDTGYSTASSHTSCTQTPRSFGHESASDRKKCKSDNDGDQKVQRKKRVEMEMFSEESETSLHAPSFFDTDSNDDDDDETTPNRPKCKRNVVTIKSTSDPSASE